MKTSPGVLAVSPSIAIIVASLLLCGCPESGAERQTNAKARPSDAAAPGASDLEKQGEQARADVEKNQKPDQSGLEKQSSASTSAAAIENETAEETEKPRDLGPPLVDNPDDLVKLPA